MKGRYKSPLFRKGDSGSCRPVSLAAVPAKVTKQIPLEAISRHTKDDEKVIGISQHEFIKGK